MTAVEKSSEKGEHELQFCLCFSSYNNPGFPLFWYRFNPKEDSDSNELPNFFKDCTEFPKIPQGFSCALVGSKLYLVGGSSGIGDANLRAVHCYDMGDESWVSKREMTLFRYKPQLVISHYPLASMGKEKKENEISSSFYIYSVGSGLSHTNPLATLEPLVEVYDEDTDMWYSPPKPLDSSIDTRGIYDTTIVEIDSRKKLFITLAFKTITLDLETEEWKDVTDRFWELRQVCSDSSPVFYNNVWYVYDDNEKAVRGFDFSERSWFTLGGLGGIDTYNSYLFNIGENMYLVCCTPNSDRETSSVYSVKFKITKDDNKPPRAEDVFKSPSWTVRGTEFLHCLPIRDSVCFELEIQSDREAADETITIAAGKSAKTFAAVEAEKLHLLEYTQFYGLFMNAAIFLSKIIKSLAEIDNTRAQQEKEGTSSEEIDNMRARQGNKGTSSREMPKLRGIQRALPQRKKKEKQ